MIRRLQLTPELLLYFQRGCVEVVADPLPAKASIVARGVNERGDFYIDVESGAFITTDPITPILRRCERCNV